MADRILRAALAGALIMAGCVVAAWGSFAVLSTELCPPQQGLVPETCVPASLMPWYGLAFMFAVAGAGYIVLGVGAVLYLRAKTA